MADCTPSQSSTAAAQDIAAAAAPSGGDVHRVNPGEREGKESGSPSQPPTPPETSRKRSRCETNSKKPPKEKRKIIKPKVVIDFCVKKRTPKNAQATPKAKRKKTPKSNSATPNPATPDEVPPSRRRKYASVQVGVQDEEKENLDCVYESSCRRSLNFDIQNFEDGLVGKSIGSSFNVEENTAKPSEEENFDCVFESSCKRSLNFDAPYSSCQREVREDSQVNMRLVEKSIEESLNYDTESQVKKEHPEIIHTLAEGREILENSTPKKRLLVYYYRRRSKRMALINAFKLDARESSSKRSKNLPCKKRRTMERRRRKALLELVLPTEHQIKAAISDPERFGCVIRGKTLLELVLPTKHQIKAAISDPERFRCVIDLCPLLKLNTRGKRKARRARSYYPNATFNFTHLPSIPSVKVSKNLNLKLGNIHDSSMVEPPIDLNREPYESEVVFEGMGNTVTPTNDLNLEFNYDWKNSEFNDWKKTIRIAVKEVSVNENRWDYALFDESQTPKVSLDQSGAAALKKLLINTLTERFGSICISEREQFVVNGREMVLIGNSQSIVPYGSRKSKKEKSKVDLDSETVRRWNLWDNNETQEEVDEETEKMWERERAKLASSFQHFLDIMRQTLGNRQFSPWKGSVTDSVIGVYLTQNVGDTLSSGAFMSMVQHFPRHFASKSIKCLEYVAHSSNTPTTEIAQIPSEEELGFVEEQQALQDNTPLHIVEDTLSSELKNGEDKVVFGEEPVVPNIVSTTETDKRDDLVKERRVEAEQVVENVTQPDKQRKKGKPKEKKQEIPIDWDELRRKHWTGRKSDDLPDTMDRIDWEAVRRATVEEIAKVIMDRGMHNVIARKIKEFLDRMVKDHGSTDLEWLRDIPPEKAKEFFMSIGGIGLKSTECLRLLTLHQIAFPVDTNVARVAVRLGWVPIQPLPGGLEFHDLDSYPIFDDVQKYLWTRLKHLDYHTLYELHYMLITFGKVFCTKKRPNCSACPMQFSCKHYASANKSNMLRLPAPDIEDVGSPVRPDIIQSQCLPDIPPVCPDTTDNLLQPEPLRILRDTDDDYWYEDDNDEINYLGIPDMSDVLNPVRDLVLADDETANIPLPKMKTVARLHSIHDVFVIPDTHPLLSVLNLDQREPGDLNPYLLATWDESELQTDQSKSPEPDSSNQMSVEQYLSPVPGTILIPCRTANHGFFPLNGTYFQTNEVFADDETSEVPAEVPRGWLIGLERRFLYCGTSASTIFRGLSLEDIQRAFHQEFICVRGFNRKTQSPKALPERFHIGTATAKKKKV